LRKIFALKEKKMNCEEIKQKIDIRTVLEMFGRFPVKENKRSAFYFALDREEKHPAFLLISSKIRHLTLVPEKVMM
jgi:hypothetical protein